jgi:hypothetical protein
VPLYENIGCTRRIEAVDGVIIESISPDGTRTKHIYPAGREFTEGEIVGWDWDTSRGVGEAYYMNPETEKPQPAWSGAAFFVGKRVVL